MKKFFRIILVASVIFLLSAVTAFADMGSKPRVQVAVKNPPREKYYLDLLYDAKGRDIHPNSDAEDYPWQMYEVLHNYNDNGWIPALAAGTSIPMWGNLERDENGKHIFSYFGVPDEFKIIIVTESGDIKISDIVKRDIMEISLVLDCNDMSYATKPAWMAYIAQFGATCSITVVVELIVLMLFFMAVKENFKPFIKMNLITQLFLTAVMSTGFITAGTMGAYMWFPVAELVIFIFEMWYSKKYFAGESDVMKLAYAFVANAASALLTFFSLDAIMDIMFKAIR